MQNVDRIAGFKPLGTINLHRSCVRRSNVQERFVVVLGMDRALHEVLCETSARGITHLKEIVQATLAVLIGAGARPFIVQAMGSHGGATPEGQIQVLTERCVTDETTPQCSDRQVSKLFRLSHISTTDAVPESFGENHAEINSLSNFN